MGCILQKGHTLVGEIKENSSRSENAAASNDIYIQDICLKCEFPANREREAALALSEKQVEYSGDTRSESSDDTTPDTEFVDDPIELMKKLKKKRGGA